MVISSRPLVELVPVVPAAMEGRQLCQWDKDSCADAGFLKIDLLGLGMLSAIEDCVERIALARGETVDLSRIPLDDQGVYGEIQAADTVGTFQIESRAQMQSLLRTRPAEPGRPHRAGGARPAGADPGRRRPSVHRPPREAPSDHPDYPIEYDHPLLEEPLEETFGVVVFQDQVLEVAMALAGFSIGEAEGLRRAMSRKRSEEAIEAFRERFVDGAARNGVDARDGERGLRQARCVLGIRLPEVPCGGIRAARLPVVVAASLLPGGVPVCAPECAADGLLPSCEPRARRTAPRRDRAAAGRERQRRGVHDRGGRRSRRCRLRDRRGGGGGGGRCRRPPLRGHPRPRPARPRRPCRAAGARLRGRLRLLRRAAAQAALAARPCSASEADR